MKYLVLIVSLVVVLITDECNGRPGLNPIEDETPNSKEQANPEDFFFGVSFSFFEDALNETEALPGPNTNVRKHKEQQTVHKDDALLNHIEDETPNSKEQEDWWWDYCFHGFCFTIWDDELAGRNINVRKHDEEQAVPKDDVLLDHIEDGTPNSKEQEDPEDFFFGVSFSFFEDALNETEALSGRNINVRKHDEKQAFQKDDALHDPIEDEVLKSKGQADPEDFFFGVSFSFFEDALNETEALPGPNINVRKHDEKQVVTKGSRNKA